MANLRENVPGEFTDDERWYKYFTLKTLIAFVSGALIDFFLTVAFRAFHLGVLGFILGTGILLVIMALTALRWPLNDTLRGGGRVLGLLAWSVVCRRRNAAVYTMIFTEEEDGGDRESR